MEMTADQNKSKSSTEKKQKTSSTDAPNLANSWSRRTRMLLPGAKMLQHSPKFEYSARASKYPTLGRAVAATVYANSDEAGDTAHASTFWFLFGSVQAQQNHGSASFPKLGWTTCTKQGANLNTQKSEQSNSPINQIQAAGIEAVAFVKILLSACSAADGQDDRNTRGKLESTVEWSLV